MSPADVATLTSRARVLTVLAVSAVVCGLGSGLAPSLQWTRGGLRHDLARAD